MRPKAQFVLYQNPSIPTDWLFFLSVDAQAELFLYQEHQSFFYAKKSPMSKNDKLVDKVKKLGLNLSKNHKNINACKNFHVKSQGCGRLGDLACFNDYLKSKALNNTLTSRTNNTRPCSLGNYSKDICFSYNNIGHWSNLCLDLALKN